MRLHALLSATWISLWRSLQHQRLYLGVYAGFFVFPVLYTLKFYIYISIQIYIYVYFFWISSWAVFEMVYTRLKIYIYINNSISHQKAIHIHHGILEKKTKTICLLFATPCVCPCWSCRWELAQAAGSSLAAFPGLVHGNLCICHPRYAIYMYIYI